MGDQLVPRHLLVELSERPGEAGARRGERLEAERCEQLRGADVPRVRHDEELVPFVQGPEASATIHRGHLATGGPGRSGEPKSGKAGGGEVGVAVGLQTVTGLLHLGDDARDVLGVGDCRAADEDPEHEQPERAR